jgi:putative peptidoglycan lipid II flippase
MGGVLFLIDAFIDMDTGSKIMQVVSLTLEIAAGVLIYFTAVLLMRVEEAINIKNKFISKFSGLIRRKA